MNEAREDIIRRTPLQWPTGWRRTHPSKRLPARFRTGYSRTTMPDALSRLEAEFRRWGIHDFAVSSNIPVKLNGLPYAGAAEPPDPGTAVYFRMRAGGRPKVFACDRWDRVADNLAAIAGHIAALRQVERYAVGETEQVLAGYNALPASATDWRLVFGFTADAVPKLEDVEARFLEAIKREHPDRTGNAASGIAARLTEARELARAELGR